MIGYCWEMGVAEQQLRWIYSAEFMPFEFIYAESRHMWDESRHGDSGYHRLKDFGLDFEHFGYSSYGVKGDGDLPPMTPKEVYENFYGVTQIAETGYFATKRYCFDDFATHGDDASAEMMQYDIIDETSHVEYGRHVAGRDGQARRRRGRLPRPRRGRPHRGAAEVRRARRDDAADPRRLRPRAVGDRTAHTAASASIPARSRRPRSCETRRPTNITSGCWRSCAGSNR